jgi:hypothetical protein
MLLDLEMKVKVNTIHFDFESCFAPNKNLEKNIAKAKSLVATINPDRIKFILDLPKDKEIKKRFSEDIYPTFSNAFEKEIDKTPIFLSDLFGKISFLLSKQEMDNLYRLYTEHAKKFPKILESIYQVYLTYGLLPKAGVGYFVSTHFDTETLYRVGSLDTICMKL